MGTVTFVLGLAGSGKSWLVSRLKVDRAFEEGFDAPESREQFHAELLARLRAGQHCTVSEVAFLAPARRDEYVSRLTHDLNGNVRINWVCFDNNLAAADYNCRERANKLDDPGGLRHMAINQLATRQYVIPEGAIVLKTYGT